MVRPRVLDSGNSTTGPGPAGRQYWSWDSNLWGWGWGCTEAQPPAGKRVVCCPGCPKKTGQGPMEDQASSRFSSMTRKGPSSTSSTSQKSGNLPMFSASFTPPYASCAESNLHLLPSPHLPSHLPPHRKPAHPHPHPHPPSPILQTESKQGVFWCLPTRPSFRPASQRGGRLSPWREPWAGLAPAEFCSEMARSRLLAGLVLAALLSHGKACPGTGRHLREETEGDITPGARGDSPSRGWLALRHAGLPRRARWMGRRVCEMSSWL